MPTFSCSTCGSAFEVPDATLARFPGWTPRHCRKHRPTRSGGRGGSVGGGASRSRRRAGRQVADGESEHPSPAEVLERFGADRKGPQSGLFTDGSSKPNPGPGGWGVVWVADGEVLREKHGHEGRTTNNRMELTALIEALRLLPEDAEETVYTDSRLCVDTITKWAPGWERNGWKKKGGEIKNLELVQELLALARARPGCELRWIAAHSGHLWNEYADALSTNWMR